jgi:hypothetical protein
VIGGFIGKAIGEPIRQNKLVPVGSPVLALSGQPIGLIADTAPGAQTPRLPLLQSQSGKAGFWKGRS